MYVISTLRISNPQRRTTKWGSECQQWDTVQDSSEITSNVLHILSYSLARLKKMYERVSIPNTEQLITWVEEKTPQYQE